MDRSVLKRIGVTVLMALLVATAGCSGLTGGGDNGNGAGDGDGSGYDVAGDRLDGSVVTEATQSAIEESGSYTTEVSSEFSVVIRGEERTTSGETTTKVDFEANEGLRERVQSSGNQSQTTVVYTNDSASYRKQTAGGQTTYDMAQESQFGGITPVNVTDFTQNYTSIVDGFTWEQAGTTEVSGTTVTEYTMTGVADKTLLGISANATVEGASGSLYVASDGVVRKVSLDYTVTGQSGESGIDVTQTVTDVGSTSVSEPDWLSKAQS